MPHGGVILDCVQLWIATGIGRVMIIIDGSAVWLFGGDWSVDGVAVSLVKG